MTTAPSKTDPTRKTPVENGLSKIDLARLRSLIETHTDWLTRRLVEQATHHGYIPSIPPPQEVWFKSISGISASLVAVLKIESINQKQGPDYDFASDPIADHFSVNAENRDREPGISLEMCLGLLKCYRETYLELIEQKTPDATAQNRFSWTIRRFFDRIEIALCTSWRTAANKEQNQHVQDISTVLSHQSAKYFTIFESLQSPVAILNKERRIDTVNHAWSILFGGTTVPGAEHSINPGISRSIAWLAAELEAFFFSDSVEERLEKQVKTAMGIRYLSVRLQQMVDMTETLGGCMVILDDITEQKRTESALQEMTVWFQEIFNSLEDAVFTVSPDGLVVSTNKAAQRIFGYTNEEMKNQTSKMLHIDADHYKAFNARVCHSIGENHHISFEYEAKRKNDDIFPVWVNVTRLEKSDGTPLGIVGVLRDISTLKVAEEARRDSERLQGALELAGAVCHDMNQPLMAIAGYAELLLMDFDEETPQAIKLKKIMDQVKKMGDITRRLMHVTRYETKVYLDQKIIDIEKASPDNNKSAL